MSRVVECGMAGKRDTIIITLKIGGKERVSFQDGSFV